TALLLSQAEKPPQVVLLTSPEPGEGKTVTTLNLGIALAQNGDSVLLIDGDMRQGRCHTRLGLRNNKGLSNVLTGSLSLEQSIQRTSLNGLSLLSRGNLPPNPTELLGSSKMREILQELRQRFKFILIDSPPVLAVSDAAVLSTISDGIVLVFDGQKTSTPSAQKTLERLSMLRAPLLGVVLNGVNLDNPHYSYYRTYSSYYVYEPNGDQASTNGKNRDAAVQKFDTLSKIAQFWSAKGPLQAKDRPKTTADSKSLKDHSTNNCENTSGVGSEGVIDEADILEPVSTSPTIEKAPSSAENPTAPLSEESCNRLIEALTIAIGPAAPLVVREQIAALGESWAAFPKRRLEELVGLISQEILNEETRNRFRQKMSKEIRSMKESPNNIRA
ncbi:MAG TPA: CpsD/CapB family tyrosine-protein kinase, partial [Candidatus Binatia bacterium]|nr:CpsD/CapB family tyrosine-protein kinase [Candidatus Binatia bacterium]